MEGTKQEPLSTSTGDAMTGNLTRAQRQKAVLNEQVEQISSTFPAGLRVVVVDDDPLCLKMVSEMLKRCSYTGEPTVSGVSVPNLGPGKGVAVDEKGSRVLLSCRSYPCPPALCFSQHKHGQGLTSWGHTQ
jgi:hypothetical protein